MRQQVALHGKDNRIGGVDPIPPGRWEYAGTADPLLHGWGNAGGGLQEFRWRRTNENETEIQGFIYGGTANPVINLPDPYRPGEIQHAVGSDSAGHVIIWELEPSGNLNLYTTTSAVTGTEITDAGGIIYEFANTGDWLQIESGVTVDAPNTEHGQSSMLLQVKGTGYWPVVLRVSQDDGTTWSEYHFGYGTSDFYYTSLQIYDENDDTRFVFGSDGNSYQYLKAGNEHIIYDSTSTEIFKIAEDHTIYFTDSSGNPNARLDDDGTLHLKSGASIVYDL